MKATLIYHEKCVYADGAVREMIPCQLSGKTEERPHGMKYRLYYGLSDVWWNYAVLEIFSFTKRSLYQRASEKL
jgi:hypothetical protein